MATARAIEPFWFKTQLSLVELTGWKAADAAELCHHLKSVPESSVYYHTHHFLQQHQFLTPEPPNDFAYWVTTSLQEDGLGEKLAAIDTIRYSSLPLLRDAIVSVLEKFLQRGQPLRKAPDGDAFYFMKSVIFSMPTDHCAHDLKEFLQALSQVSIHCLYNHIFTARLRPPLGVNDFSHWLCTSLGEEDLAHKIERLDPYTRTMEGLRKEIARLVEERLRK